MKKYYLNKIIMSNVILLVYLLVANEAQAGFVRDNSMSVMLGVNTSNGVLNSKIQSGNYAPKLSILSEVVLVQKLDIAVHEFIITKAGSYTASLKDFKFPGSLTDLKLSIHSTNPGFQSLILNQSGTTQFYAQTGTYIATLTGTAGNNRLSSFGLYGFEVAGITSVPLPGALLFFLSGLTFIGFSARRRKFNRQ